MGLALGGRRDPAQPHIETPARVEVASDYPVIDPA
jgi:hypothetical protein